MPFLEGKIIRIFVTKNLHVDASSSFCRKICFYLLRRLYKSLFSGTVRYLPKLLEVILCSSQVLSSFFSLVAPRGEAYGQVPSQEATYLDWQFTHRMERCSIWTGSVRLESGSLNRATTSPPNSLPPDLLCSVATTCPDINLNNTDLNSILNAYSFSTSKAFLTVYLKVLSHEIFKLIFLFW